MEYLYGLSVVLLACLFYGAIAYVFFRLMFGSSSFRYRKHLTNLYVAAKVKEIAKKDGIDLIEENKEFKKMFSFKKDIDDKIEEEIVGKIEEGMNKKGKK